MPAGLLSVSKESEVPRYVREPLRNFVPLGILNHVFFHLCLKEVEVLRKV